MAPSSGLTPSVVAAALPASVVLASFPLVRSLRRVFDLQDAHAVLVLTALFLAAWVPGVFVLRRVNRPAPAGLWSGYLAVLAMLYVILGISSEPRLVVFMLLWFGSLALGAGAAAGGVAAWTTGRPGRRASGITMWITGLIVGAILMAARPDASVWPAWLVPGALVAGGIAFLAPWNGRKPAAHRSA